MIKDGKNEYKNGGKKAERQNMKKYYDDLYCLKNQLKYVKTDSL
jgi:hypothetical protein